MSWVMVWYASNHQMRTWCATCLSNVARDPILALCHAPRRHFGQECKYFGTARCLNKRLDRFIHKAAHYNIFESTPQFRPRRNGRQGVVILGAVTQTPNLKRIIYHMATKQSVHYLLDYSINPKVAKIIKKIKIQMTNNVFWCIFLLFNYLICFYAY